MHTYMQQQSIYQGKGKQTSELHPGLLFRRAAWKKKMKQLPTIAHYIYDATIPFLNAGQTLCCIQYHNLYANHSP